MIFSSPLTVEFSRYHSRRDGKIIHAELVGDLVESWDEITKGAIASALSAYDSQNGVWSVDEDEQDRGDDGELVSSDSLEV
jgi:hypothetical protein